MSTIDTRDDATPPAPPQPSLTGRPATPVGGRPWSLTWHGVRTVARLELRQRIRSTRWIVSLVVFGALVGGVSLLTWLAARSTGVGGTAVGPTMFGFIAFFVLFLGLLVSPTLSATSINGDRAAGTLATLQVTLLSAAEIALGKLLAAWVASLAFLAVAVPFIVWAFATGDTSPGAVITTIGLIALMLAVVCAIGMGFSALTARTSGSAVLTYVTVASLSVVSLIVFGLTTPLVSGMETVRVYQQEVPDLGTKPSVDEDGFPLDTYGKCVWTEEEVYVTHTERTWWLLAINPFVIVADAAPAPTLAKGDYASFDPLSGIRQAVRSVRMGPPETLDWCWQELDPNTRQDAAGGAQDSSDLSPVWPWGLGLNLLLGAAGVALAVRRLTVPLRTLPRGTRVA